MVEFFRVILYEPLFNLLVFFAWLVPGHSMGWSIVILTVLVRLALWLPTMKSLRTPLLLNQYRDEVAQLQEKYKDDRSAQARALMAFYKEKGVSPFSGCLPLLIQLPILIVLYHVFIVGLKDLRPDLLYSFTPHLDSINAQFFGLDLAKPDRVFLPLLAAAMQFLQARHFQMLNPISGGKSDPTVIMTRQMQYLFPVMTYFIAITLPAGLPLYWATTTGISWLQQVYAVKTFKPIPRARVTVRNKS